jgi:hypothetical protein
VREKPLLQVNSIVLNMSLISLVSLNEIKDMPAVTNTSLEKVEIDEFPYLGNDSIEELNVQFRARRGKLRNHPQAETPYACFEV